MKRDYVSVNDAIEIIKSFDPDCKITNRTIYNICNRNLELNEDYITKKDASSSNYKYYKIRRNAVLKIYKRYKRKAFYKNKKGGQSD